MGGGESRPRRLFLRSMLDRARLICIPISRSERPGEPYELEQREEVVDDYALVRYVGFLCGSICSLDDPSADSPSPNSLSFRFRFHRSRRNDSVSFTFTSQRSHRCNLLQLCPCRPSSLSRDASVPQVYRSRHLRLLGGNSSDVCRVWSGRCKFSFTSAFPPSALVRKRSVSFRN